MKILETERLMLREIVESDAGFVFDLVNSPSFIKYIGNRGIDTIEKAQKAVEERYQASYKENGYGLYAVVLKETNEPIGFCGFVRREGLDGADIGFAFLPQFERKGFGFESASAMMKYGREKLNLGKVLAITTRHNESSIRLLEKLGFKFERLIKMPNDEAELNLFSNE